jgi:hypothetical protein
MNQTQMEQKMSSVCWLSHNNGCVYWLPKIGWVKRYPIAISSRINSTTALFSCSSAESRYRPDKLSARPRE